jgi:hypothetical protein
LYVSAEKAIILGLFVLLYEKGRDNPTLRALSNRLLDPKVFCLTPESKKKLMDTIEFFKDEKLYDRLRENRNNFIAHVASIQPTAHNQVESEHIYRLVPKTVYLAELLEEALKVPSHRYDNQFNSRAREIALYFSHTKPDELLAELFSARSLPAAEYNAKAELFLKRLYQRERSAR